MKTIISILSILTLSAAALAQTPASAAGGTLSDLARRAKEDLDRSTQELLRVNKTIEAAKLPLSEQLSAGEEKLDQLKKKNYEVGRQVDDRNLEMVKAKAEIKAREEQLAYVGNLLDEYAKDFETKVNASEVQLYADAIDKTKQAAVNPDLPTEEKLSRQTMFVGISLKRAFDGIGGQRFPGEAVDPQGTVVTGQFALVGPVAMFSSKSGSAGMVIPQTGSTKPLIRPLEGALQIDLKNVVETGEGMLPFDPSRGAALKQLVQKFNLMKTFHKGGPVMYPLLVASILALFTVVERLIFLLVERARQNRKALRQFFLAVEHRNIDEAIRLGNQSNYFVVRALAYALQHRQEETLSSALMYAQAREIKRFQRGIPILDTVITLAPLLGLLGTVTGMMGSFSLVGGEISSAGAITGGIAEALIATAFGLGIAITSLLPFNFLNARVDEARHELESAAAQLEIMVRTLPSREAGGLPTPSTGPGHNGDKKPAANGETHLKPVVIAASAVQHFAGESAVKVPQT